MDEDLTGRKIRCRRDVWQDALLEDGFPAMKIASKGAEGVVVRRSPYPDFAWVVHIPTHLCGAPAGFTEDVHVKADEIEAIPDAPL